MQCLALCRLQCPKNKSGRNLQSLMTELRALSINKTMSALGQMSDSILMIQEGSTDKDELLWWHSASCKEVSRIFLHIKKLGLCFKEKKVLTENCLPEILPEKGIYMII